MSSYFAIIYTCICYYFTWKCLEIRWIDIQIYDVVMVIELSDTILPGTSNVA